MDGNLLALGSLISVRVGSRSFRCISQIKMHIRAVDILQNEKRKSGFSLNLPGTFKFIYSDRLKYGTNPFEDQIKMRQFLIPIEIILQENFTW